VTVTAKLGQFTVDETGKGQFLPIIDVIAGFYCISLIVQKYALHVYKI